jgi:hypothetical protein
MKRHPTWQSLIPRPIVAAAVFLCGQVAIDLVERKRAFLLAAWLGEVNLHVRYR